MSKLEAIHQVAQKTLIFSTPSGGRDDWLWDRTLRILRNIEPICRLPELAEQAISIDRFCLIAAAYFADSGLAHFASNQKSARHWLPADLTSADLCKISPQIVSDTLADVISEARINKINKIITESFNRFTDVTEAMVLSDGRGLEELGLAGLLGGLRGQLGPRHRHRLRARKLPVFCCPSGRRAAVCHSRTVYEPACDRKQRWRRGRTASGNAEEKITDGF